jgi:cytochrome b561
MTMETTATPAVTPAAAMPVRRYHPAQVVLHWAIAALIFITALLASGGEGEGRRQAAGFAGIPTLTFHMILGISVLVLLFIRLLMRWRIKSPEWATTGSAFLDRIGRWTHIALYVFAFSVTVTGLVLALQTNRLARAFSAPASGFGQFRPGQFATPPGGSQPGQFPPGGLRPGGEGGEGFGGGFARGGRFFLGAFHAASWTILLLLIILHVGAALYHQFMRKDNLFGRMWFGKSASS